MALRDILLDVQDDNLDALRKFSGASVVSNKLTTEGDKKSKGVLYSRILVNPKVQYANFEVTNYDDIAGAILKKIKQKREEVDFENSLFARSFLTPELGMEFKTKSASAMQSNGSIILPPIILRSETDTKIQLRDVYLICHASGVIIPAIKDASKLPSESMLNLLYQLQSKQYVNNDNFMEIAAEYTSSLL